MLHESSMFILSSSAPAMIVMAFSTNLRWKKEKKKGKKKGWDYG